MKINKLRLINKKEYLIVSREKFSKDNDFLDYIAASLENGIQIIQLKEKHFNDKRTIELGKKIRELCSIYEALFIVNSRADIAQLVHADGIHLDADGIDSLSARELLGQNIIIGKTLNKEDKIDEIDKNIDYIFTEKTLENTDITQFIYSEIKKF